MRKLTGSTFANILVVVALAIIPLMYAGLLTSAYQNPTNRLATMTAAVVDLDTPADIALATGETRHFALGDQLADRLTDPPAGEDVGFTWVRMDSEAQARAAMSAEDIRAMLVVPADFTASATRVATDDPASASQQTLRLVTDDGVNYLAGTLARTVASEMEGVMTGEGVDQYVDNIVMSLGTIKDGMQDAQSGAATLAGGADALQSGLTRLAGGADTAADGASQLANGAATLADGTASAADGAGALQSGITALSGGAQTLSSGIGRYTAGVSTAADGARQLADGAQSLTTLSDGVTTYTSGVDRLAGQIPTLADGASQLAAGTTQLVGSTAGSTPGGLAALSAGLGAPTDGAGSATLVGGVTAYTQGVDQINAALTDPATAASLSTLTQGAATLDDGVTTYTGTVARIQQLCAASHGATDATCAALTQLIAQNDALTAGASAVNSGVTTLGGSVQSAAAATGALSAQSQALRTSTSTAAAGAQQALAGARALQTGAAALSAGVGTAADVYDPATGSGATASGVLATLSAQSDALRAGAATSTQLIPATARLSGGLQTLSGQSPALTDGAHTLSGGVSTAAAQVPTMVAGLRQLADGSATLSDSTAALAQGATALDDAAHTAATGSDALVEGLSRLEGGLSDGAARIPTYTDADADHIADVLSKPVAVEATRDHGVANNGAGFTPMFMSLALWVGGIAIFLVLPALDRRPSPTERWWYAPLRPATTATLLGVAQAVLMMTIVNATVGLDARNVGGLILLAIAASLTFVAVNQACLAAMAYRGRFVSIILLSLQITAMGATFPIETAPRFFQWIHPLLPMSYTQLAFREMIAGAGADHAVRNALIVLAVWFAAAVAVTFLSARLRGGRRPLRHDNALLQDQLVDDAEARAAQARVDLEKARALQAGAPGGERPGIAAESPAQS